MKTYSDTRKRLEKSILHWRRIVKGKRTPGEWHYTEDCALCEKFCIKECKGCPVAVKTGQIMCLGSPWINVEASFKYGLKKTKNYEAAYSFPDVRQKAQEMLDFLISLRKNTP